MKIRLASFTRISPRRAGLVAVAVLVATSALLMRPAHAAVIHISTTTGNNAGGATSLSIDKPTSTTDNHVMIAVISVRGGTGRTITPPGGWTLINSSDSDAVLKSSAYYKVASSEGSSYTFNFSSSAKASGVITSYSGVDTSNPIDAQAVQANASDNINTAPSVTTTVANTMLVALYSTASGTTLLPGDSMTIRGSDASTEGTASSRTTSTLQDAVQAATGASGSKIMTASAGVVNIGHLVALKPDGGTTTLGASSYRWYEPDVSVNSDENFVETPNPDQMPGNSLRSVSWSPNGQYMVATANNDTSGPRLVIYKRSGDTFVKLPDPSDMPTGGQTYDSSWTPDNQYLAVGTYSTGNDKLIVYKRSGDTFTKLADPSDMPGNNVMWAKWSPDGTYLAVGSNTSTGGAARFVIYKRSGDTLTKLANPSTMPSTNVYSGGWSPDGTYLTVVGNGMPTLVIYKRSGDTFTKLSDPSYMSPETTRRAVWSPDGKYLSVVSGLTTADKLIIYKQTGDTFTKLPDPTLPPGNVTWGVSWSPGGQYMATSSQNGDGAKRLTLYKVGTTLGASTPLVAQNTAHTLSSGNTTNLRLRQSVRIDGSPLASGAALKLQYAPKVSTCSAGSYTDVGTGDFTYHDALGAGHGTLLSTSGSDPTDGARGIVGQTFVKTSQPFIIENPTDTDSNALWDFSLTAHDPAPGTYCFRIVYATGTPLDSYLQYPELTIGSGSTGPTLEQQMRGGQGVVDGVKMPIQL